MNELRIKAIIVCGKSNAGKTTSILSSAQSIIKKLQEMFEEVVVDGPNSYGKRNSKDKWFVISACGKRIAILSRGDNKWEIEAGLGRVKECDFYICASHVSGETIDCLINRFGNDETIFVNKIGVSNRSIREFDSDYEQKRSEILTENDAFACLITDLFFKYFRME